ncbi:hypothetical protein PBI_BEAGLE_1 [Arthrobacter phage Beagle]|nr:hypothetical protein PBI_BEAGLE_1 [Arthrobacter phage Beagle]
MFDPDPRSGLTTLVNESVDAKARSPGARSDGRVQGTSTAPGQPGRLCDKCGNTLSPALASICGRALGRISTSTGWMTRVYTDLRDMGPKWRKLPLITGRINVYRVDFQNRRGLRPGRSYQ